MFLIMEGKESDDICQTVIDEETGELLFDLSYNIDAASSDEKIDCEITVQGNEWLGLLNINENQLV